MEGLEEEKACAIRAEYLAGMVAVCMEKKVSRRTNRRGRRTRRCSREVSDADMDPLRSDRFAFELERARNEEARRALQCRWRECEEAEGATTHFEALDEQWLESGLDEMTMLLLPKSWPVLRPNGDGEEMVGSVETRNRVRFDERWAGKD
jgi:hypothetical protein